MRRVPAGSVIMGSVALAGAAALLAVTVLQAVSADPPGGAPPADVAVDEAVAVEAPGLQALPAHERVDGDGPEAVEAPPREALETDGADRPGRVRGALERVVSDPEVGGADVGQAAAPAAWDDPLILAVDNDPFHPDRRPPAQRYRLPSERVPAVREEPRERPEAPDFRIVGAASVGNTGLALVQLDRDEPRLVAMGESFRGYTLTAVDGEGATLAGPAGDLRYPVMEPLDPRDDDDDDRRRRRRSRNRNDEAESRAREYQERLEQVRNAIQRIQIRGRAIQLGNGRVVFPGGGGGPVEIPPPPPAR